MANDAFNGTTITFGGTAIDKVRSIDFTDEANEVDTTSLDDSTHAFVAGIKSLECNVEVLGNPALSEGDTGAIVLTWFNGDSDSIGSGICTSVSKSGTLDGEIATTYAFKPFGG